MKDTITLQDVLTIVRRHVLFIISFTLFVALVTAFISYFILQPIYEAETQLLVNQKNTEQPYIGVQQVETDLRLINTYNIIIKSPAILSKVINNLNLDMTPEILMEQITVTSANNSQVVNINVEDKQADLAVDIANMIADVFQEEIQILMTVDNVNILSVAKSDEEPEPVAPNQTLYIVAASFIAFTLSASFTILVASLDTTIKTEQDVEDTIGLPIIGLISQISDVNRSARVGTHKMRRE
ncbi:YveK family protein [Lysinibacillus sphaericus]|uniref:Capsular polysaccharide biosynthesis protein n=1 Tax=Lysinibacillus sphaericus OT4b.31 TaxID=1285586 RepID=R7ZGX1_LYSSH|nr:Wzz/FepE/Etk N-terminal domain-containing protein [Lysinibacillus sphaericus]EON73377.1 capsular polysaccharide biosynthesis protein [Lysinibacillus sphaericus OT4b.31]